jgi:uncharacterized protein (TIGR02300 family)
MRQRSCAAGLVEVFDVAKPELGMKRQCQNCGAKFFDLSRDPIVCPKCGTTFQVTALSRAPARAAVADDDDEVEVDTANVELVSLEDADAADEKAVVVPDDDIEIEDDAGDETFLEEEEGDSDDVTGLIDGDLEDDEET